MINYERKVVNHPLNKTVIKTTMAMDNYHINP